LRYWVHWNQLRCLHCRLLPNQQSLLFLCYHQSSLYFLLGLYWLLGLRSWLYWQQLRQLRPRILHFISFALHLHSVLRNHHPLRSVRNLLCMHALLHRVGRHSLRSVRCRLRGSQLRYLPNWLLPCRRTVPSLHGCERLLQRLQRFPILHYLRHWLYWPYL
jgi:hypothetical protein